MFDPAAPRIASVMPVAPTDAVPCSARGAVRLHAAIVTIAIFKASRIKNKRMIQSPSLHSRFEILYKLTGISRDSFRRRWSYEVGHHGGIDWGNTRVQISPGDVLELSSCQRHEGD